MSIPQKYEFLKKEEKKPLFWPGPPAPGEEGHLLVEGKGKRGASLDGDEEGPSIQALEQGRAALFEESPINPDFSEPHGGQDFQGCKALKM